MSDEEVYKEKGNKLVGLKVEIMNEEVPPDDQEGTSEETTVDSNKSEKKLRKDGKYKHRDEHELNPYNKRLILQHLIDKGSNSESCEELVERFKKTSSTTIEEYINERAKEAQEKVAEEVKSEIFQSLNDWTTAFKENMYDAQCGNELPLIFKVIAESENHPKPDEAGGIDFKQLYITLSNVMSGNPSPELGGPTKQFLKETFEELMQEIDTPDGIHCMSNIISAFKDRPTVIMIDEENARNQNDSFMMGLNPLQLPWPNFNDK